MPTVALKNWLRRACVDLGMTLIDIAEMYADGKAELVGETIAGMRDRVFLVGKAYRGNA